MIRIALIDDKSYGRQQIEDIYEWDDFVLDYYQTAKDFFWANKMYDVIYLDYYLDIDGVRWSDIFHEVKRLWKKVIWFSSVWRCNDELVALGADWGVLKI